MNTQPLAQLVSGGALLARQAVSEYQLCFSRSLLIPLAPRPSGSGPPVPRGRSADGKWSMKKDREPEQSETEQHRGPTKAEILIAILTTVTALAGCVEHLAR